VRFTLALRARAWRNRTARDGRGERRGQRACAALLFPNGFPFGKRAR